MWELLVVGKMVNLGNTKFLPIVYSVLGLYAAHSLIFYPPIGSDCPFTNVLSLQSFPVCVCVCVVL